MAGTTVVTVPMRTTALLKNLLPVLTSSSPVITAGAFPNCGCVMATMTAAMGPMNTTAVSFWRIQSGSLNGILPFLLTLFVNSGEEKSNEIFGHQQIVLSQHALQTTSCALNIAVFPSPLCAMETRTAWMVLMRRIAVRITFFLTSTITLTNYLSPQLFADFTFLLFRVHLFFIWICLCQWWPMCQFELSMWWSFWLQGPFWWTRLS